MKIVIALVATFILSVAIKTVNYGRWSARQGNRRGAMGLYALAMLLFLVPSGVYIYNMLR